MRMKIVGILKGVILAAVMVCTQMYAVTAFADTAGPVPGYSTTWTRQTGNGASISADGEGNVYSLDYNSHILRKFDCDKNKLWGKAVSADCGAIYADAAGNVYVAGSTWGSVDGYTNAGRIDFFVTKFDKYGNKKWTRQRGTEDDDEAFGICADADGNVYVTGATTGHLDGNINYSTYKPYMIRDWDLFLSKFDADGNWQWTRAMGIVDPVTGILHTDADIANGVCTDASGNVYIAGLTQIRVAPYGYYDLQNYIYVKKFNGAGVEQWTEQAGPSGYLACNGISADAGGNTYVTGVTIGDLDGVANAGSNTRDVFLMKYDSSGAKLWTRLTGAPMEDDPAGLSSDRAGNVYLAWNTDGGVYGNPVVSLVTKYNAEGVSQWTTQMDYVVNSVSADAFSNVFFGGTTNNSGTFTGFITKMFSGAVEINGNAQYTNNASVTLTVPVIDESGVAQMQFSNSPDSGWSGWQDYAATTQWTLSEGDGIKTVYAKFKDTLGNESAVLPASIILDTAPPPTVITAPTSEGFINGTGYAITGTAYDGSGSGVQKVEVSVNGGETWGDATGTTSWSYTWTPLPADGRYPVKSRSTNNLGTVQSPVTNIWVTVDNTAPSCVIASPVSNAVLTGTTCSITGTASDGGSGVQKVEVSLDGGSTWAPATGTTAWSYDWALPADGTYTVCCRATDNAGNISPLTCLTVAVDKVPPTSIIVNPANNSTVTGTVYTITGTVSPGSGTSVQKVEVSIDGGTTWVLATGTTSWSYDWTLPADGNNYTVKSRTTDAAGVVQSPVTSVSIHVNKVPPTTTITTPNGAIISGSSCSITGTASCGSAGGFGGPVEVSTDGGNTWSTVYGAQSSWSYTWWYPADGTHTVCSRATDFLGNVQSPPTCITVVVDNTNPTFTIVNPVDRSATSGTSYTINGTASDGSGSGVQKVEVSLNDGNTWTTATGTTDWSLNCTSLSETWYTIRCRVTDNAGNISTSGRVYLIVDRTPPHSSIYNLNGYYSHGISSLSGGADDASGSGIDYVDVVIDGVHHRATKTVDNWFYWSYEWDTTTLADGPHTIYSVAYDKVGLAQTTPPIYTVTVDTVPPAISFSNLVNGQTLSGTSYEIRGSVSDQGSGVPWGGVEISTDNGATWRNTAGWGSWRYTWTLPANGTYLIKARAADLAGNITTIGPVSVTVSN